MPKTNIVLKLNSYTRIRNVETDLAYALKDGNRNVHVPKKHCNLYEIKDSELFRWVIEIPIWLAIKSEKIAGAIMYIQDLNEWKEDSLAKEQKKGLEMIDNIINQSRNE